jgi:hypothetical protein
MNKKLSNKLILKKVLFLDEIYIHIYVYIINLVCGNLRKSMFDELGK